MVELVAYTAAILFLYGALIVDANVEVVTEYKAPPREPVVILIGTTTQPIEWTEEKIIEHIHKVFPEAPKLMERIAWCESRLDPKAQGPTDDHGIYQLHNPSHDLSEIDVYDVEQNVAFARRLYDETGTTPWNASRTCWYNKQT